MAKNKVRITLKSGKKKKCRRAKNCVCSESMKAKLEKHMPFLKKLMEAPVKKRVQIIKRAPSCLIRYLSECALNVLKGNLKLSDDQYVKLKPHKQVLLRVSKPSLSMRERRKILLKKKGGVLPALIPMVLPILGSLFAGVAADFISKRIS